MFITNSGDNLSRQDHDFMLLRGNKDIGDFLADVFKALVGKGCWEGNILPEPPAITILTMLC